VRVTLPKHSTVRIQDGFEGKELRKTLKNDNLDLAEIQTANKGQSICRDLLCCLRGWNMGGERLIHKPIQDWTATVPKFYPDSLPVDHFKSNFSGCGTVELRV
jgi:hypothetical protein